MKSELPSTSKSTASPAIVRLRAILLQLGPLLGLIAVWLLFAIKVGPNFTSWDNHRSMLLQTAVVGIAAIGGTMVIVSGGIDLSVGSGIALGTMVLAWLLRSGTPPGIAAALTVAGGFLLGVTIGSMVVGRLMIFAGAMCGALIGYMLVGSVPIYAALAVGVVGIVVGGWLGYRYGPQLKLTPFIVTLGMWGALRGAAKGIGDNQPIYPNQTWLTQLMTGTSQVHRQVAENGDTILQRVHVFPYLEYGVWLMLLLSILMAAVLRYTQFGRHVYAIGSNEETARLCGVHVERTKLWVYGLASLFTATAAILQFSYLGGQSDPTTAEGYELKVIASVVIGGASLAGGEGTIFGTLIGALIMTIVDTGCTKLELNNWVQEIVTGGIILAAVALDQIRHRRSAK